MGQEQCRRVPSQAVSPGTSRMKPLKQSFKAGIISGIIPTPSLYSNESEDQRLNDLVQGHTTGSKAVARTLVSQLPGQISIYYIILHWEV